MYPVSTFREETYQALTLRRVSEEDTYSAIGADLSLEHRILQDHVSIVPSQVPAQGQEHSKVLDPELPLSD